MDLHRFTLKMTIAVAVPLSLAACATTQVGEPDDRRPAPTQSRPPVHEEPQPAKLSDADLASYRQVLEPYANLVPVLDQMVESGIDEASFAQSLHVLRQRPGSVDEVARLYAALTDASRSQPHAFSEARWRSVYLLGELRLEDARKPLAEIARTSLPEAGRVADSVYATEFRLRVRAIAGLRNLQSSDELERIYSAGGPLRGVAAVALYELGKPPRGVKEIDARRTFGDVSSIDFRPNGHVIAPEMMRLPPVPQREQHERVVPETSKNR